MVERGSLGLWEESDRGRLSPSTDSQNGWDAPVTVDFRGPLSPLGPVAPAATTSIANHTFVVSGAASATADPVDPLLVCFGFLLSLEVDDGEQALALGHRAVDGVDVVEFGDGHQPDPTAWR